MDTPQLRAEHTDPRGSFHPYMPIFTKHDPTLPMIDSDSPSKQQQSIQGHLQLVSAMLEYGD